MITASEILTRAGILKHPPSPEKTIELEHPVKVTLTDGEGTDYITAINRRSGRIRLRVKNTWEPYDSVKLPDSHSAKRFR